MFNRCLDYIDKNVILNEKQFGFKTNHSTYMAIIELVDKVVSAVERNERTLCIFIDLLKAFDTIIDHDILLYKLEYYCFRGFVRDWFKSYLNIENNLFDIKHVMLSIRILSVVSPRDRF